MRQHILWLALPLLGGCEILLGLNPNLLQEDRAETCTDGIDNDENGFADCAELGCAAFCGGVPICGDGLVDAGETCDHFNLDNGDGCSADCQIEEGFLCEGSPSKCFPLCGDGIQRSFELCDDGNELNGDGCDGKCFPEDGFGCVGEPSVCSSNVTTCAAALSVANSTQNGDSSGGTPLTRGSCQADGVLNDLFAFKTGSDGDLFLTLASATDQAFSIRGDCTKTSSELTCKNGAGANQGESTRLNIDADRDLTFSVGAAFPGEEGPYTLEINFVASACGDALITGNEECDDGNAVDGDGCSAACRSELGVQCLGEPSVCVALAQFCDALPPAESFFLNDTSDGTEFLLGSCQREGAKSIGFVVTPLSDNPISAVITSDTDQVLFARSTCTDPASQLACVDNAGGGGAEERLELQGTANVPLTFFVGAFAPGNEGTFTLTLSF